MENKDIVFFDLETTGVSVTGDRIVQIAAVKVDQYFNQIGDVKDYLVNPGISIPREATEVHKITDEMVKDAPSFKAYSKGLFEFLKNCDIGGYNSNQFDIPMLSEEFARVGINWPEEGTNFADAMIIYHAEEKRDLAAALKFYCDTILLDAHNAKADILATVNVYKSQVMYYEHLRELNTYQIDQHYGGKIRVDIAGKIILNDEGEAVYSFGKDKGKSIVKNPGFAHWMLKQDFPTETKNIIQKLLKII